MTASERLAALHAAGEPWFAYDLLPALAAVVAAVEQRDEHADDCLTRLDRWCDCGRSGVLDAAVAELNRVLGDKPPEEVA